MRNSTENYVSWLIDFWLDWCLANSTDPAQTPQNSSVASDQGLHFILAFLGLEIAVSHLMC